MGIRVAFGESTEAFAQPEVWVTAFRVEAFLFLRVAPQAPGSP